MPKTSKNPKPTVTKLKPETNGSLAPENMTLAEAAAWLRVSEEGLRADAIAGHVPARQIAGEWRFNKAVLLAWFSQMEISAEKSSKEGMLSAFGAWKDYGEDPEAMITELKRARKALFAKRK